jgi:hypothetical protein
MKITSPFSAFSTRGKIFLLGWIILNIVQSMLTEVNNDEAYYYLYGQHPDWGYFDHPPMVGWMIHASEWLFNGNLGIRMATVLLQGFTLMFSWKIIRKLNPDDAYKSEPVFWMTAAAMTMFSAYGFITTPDGPLLFFTAFFLYQFQPFLDSPKIRTSIWLAIAMAGLLYSKYQGGLVILLAFLSQIRLLRHWTTWFSGVLALLLLTPHFYWQWSHDFPSFTYHLVSRSSSFKWGYFFEYLPNQLATFNPFVLIALCFVPWRMIWQQSYLRSMMVLLVGFVLFFWASSFRGHVEPHWTVAASIPLLIIISYASAKNERVYKYAHKFIFPSLLLMLLARIVIVVVPLPERIGLNGKKAYYEDLHQLAGNHPVLFEGSFQQASLYRYFTGGEATVLSNLFSRQSQFDLWRFEQAYMQDSVFICMKRDGLSKPYLVNERTIEGFWSQKWQSAHGLTIRFTMAQHSFRIGDTVITELEIFNPGKKAIVSQHDQFPLEWNMAIHQGDNWQFIKLPELQDLIIDSGETIRRTVRWEIPGLNLHEKCTVGLTAISLFGPTYHGPHQQIKITNRDN